MTVTSYEDELTADTVWTISLAATTNAAPFHRTVQVLNRDSTEDAVVAWGAPTVTTPATSIANDGSDVDTLPIPAGEVVQFDVPVSACQVKVISSATPVLSIVVHDLTGG